MSSPLRDLFDPRVHFPLMPDSASGSSSAERHSTSGDKALPPLLVVEAPSSWPEQETSLHALQREGEATSLTSGECMHESEPFFRMSECALARLEAGLRAQEKKQPHRVGQLPPVVGLGRTPMEGRGLLPRAGQLPPVFGFHALESEGSNQGSPETCSRPQTVVPLVHERSPSQAPKERRLNSGAVVLIAGVIAVAVAYYFSTAGVTPELASIGTQPVEQSPKPIATPTETKVTAQSSGGENDQGGGKSASQAEASFSRPAVSGTSIEIATPSLSTTVPPRPHRNRKVRHSGNAAQTKSP
jgi:hypothetical protein